MLGAITGDTIGSVYEFRNTKDYNFPLFKAGRSNYTDDSVMSFAVARWLLADPSHSFQALEDIMLAFAENYPCPMGGYGTGFVRWLFHPEMVGGPYGGKSPYVSSTGRHPYASWGKGAAMRVSAVGWFFDTLEETERVAALSAAITHDHPEGIKGAQATAAAIFLARTGHSKDDIRMYITERFGYDLSRSWDYWYEIYDWDSSCQGTVPQALIAFLESANFEDAIRKAVSLGGDSDTLACITGGVAEAFYGGVPEDISVKVQKKLPVPFMNILKDMKARTAYDFLPAW